MNLTELIFGLLIGFILVFNLKVNFHGVNSSWLLKTFNDLELILVKC
jgi:hypothetical protein